MLKKLGPPPQSIETIFIMIIRNKRRFRRIEKEKKKWLGERRNEGKVGSYCRPVRNPRSHSGRNKNWEELTSKPVEKRQPKGRHHFTLVCYIAVELVENIQEDEKRHDQRRRFYLMLFFFFFFFFSSIVLCSVLLLVVVIRDVRRSVARDRGH